ncbi:TonB-dependent receptor [Postechiella marina]|uniref:TonB-dependent receptor n=1 Tax=Postechiella marina TaxID=943941 RepID=A0ABP8C7I0_9FLAO
MSTTLSYGQNQIISGKVTEEGGVPLAGASIIVKGTSRGVISDFDGKFDIKAKKGEILQISYLGFIGKSVTIADNITLNITLEEDRAALEEIVVVGYGTQKKKEVTGAVTKIDSEKILQTSTPDLSTALQGQVAGVNIQAANGSPGESANIQIRGLGSLSEDALGPLYVVDGIPFEDNPNISPEQIESIDILKDGASASIYGVRASNGVILITTKKGEIGKTVVRLNSYVGIQNITSGVDRLNTLETFYQINRRDDDNASGSSPLFSNRRAFNNDSDFVEDITNDNAIIQNYALNISGGVKNLTLNFNTNYFNQEGVIIFSGFERLTNRLTASFNKGKFKAFASVNMSNEERERAPGNSYRRALSAAAYSRPISEILGNLEVVDNDDDNDNSVSGFVRDYLNKDVQETSKTNVALRLEYELLKDFNFKVNLGNNKSNSFRKRFEPQYLNFQGDDNNVLNVQGSRLNAELQEDNTRTDRRSIENILAYNKTFGKHKIGLLGVVSYEDYETIRNRVNGLFPFDAPNNNVQVLAGATETFATGDILERSLTGKLFRLQYGFDGKYLFSGSIRRDGSSKFSEKNRFGTFFGLSTGWNIHEENFMQDINHVINNFKLRVSYAELGNQSIPDYRFAPIVESGINYPFQNLSGQEVVNTGFISRRLANEDLKWETTISKNIGVDLSFLKNKLTLTMDVYENDKEDMLLNLLLPGSAGYSQTRAINTFGVVSVNAGDMTNSGVEFSASYKDRTAGGLKYSFTYNYTKNVNKVTDLNGIDRGFGGGNLFGDSTTFYAVGHEAGAFFLLKNQGVIKTDEQLENYRATLDPGEALKFNKGDLMFQDQLTVDTNGDGIADAGDGFINDDDTVYSGSGQPEFEIGFNTNLQYKGFDLSALTYFAYGLEVYNGSKLNAYRGRRHKDLLYMWTEQNPTSDIPAERGTNSENVRARSDYFLEDGTYLRIRTLTLGYNFPRKKIQNIGLDRARVYLTSVNPFTFTDYDGFDPEVGGNGLSTRGVDNGNYPVARQFSVGLQVNF